MQVFSAALSSLVQQACRWFSHAVLLTWTLRFRDWVFIHAGH